MQILSEFGVFIQTLPVSVVMGEAALSFQPSLRPCPKNQLSLREEGFILLRVLSGMVRGQKLLKELLKWV